ncbi:poly(A) RNA polymerase GLD2-like isoform X3 [Centruroides sculpturatus]|uniref:poly(A) RNA polymerase GLD2-like isoform X3 n=1 Tax=Centruroides sculpturatus TaxID=218467 RepID=UPI000C6E62E6|nr:poly(A) RNA polymerase GLD2-like isoform X3 [Centruroides sculpturatus]
MLQMPSQWMVPPGRDNYSLIPIESRLVGSPPLNIFALTFPMNMYRLSGINPYMTVPNQRERLSFPYFANNWPPVQPVRFYHPQRHFSRDSLGESSSSCDGSLLGSRPSTPLSSAITLETNLTDQDKSALGGLKQSQTKGLKRQLNPKHSPKRTQSSTNNKQNFKRQKKQSDNSVFSTQNSSGSIHWDKLSQQIWTHYLENKQTRDIYEQKIRLRTAVHNILNCAFNFECSVYIVGSSMNGFGTTTSDVDMCLMLSNTEVDQQTEATQILKYIFKIISKCNFVSHPTLINAKVPLLRFIDCNSGLFVDLNVNNIEGIRNTHLLKCYTCLDWRVQPLVLIIKEWAQEYNINNAKEKTLSSYSLVLLVIHYLQCGCVPPVIPCLQKLKPNLFLSTGDIRRLNTQNLPSFKSKNEQDLGELFIGFLDYYSNKFNFSKDAISIRLGCKLPKQTVMSYKSQKNKKGHWKYICIEEPFSRTNTACSVFEEIPFQKIMAAFKTSWFKLKENKDLKCILNI